MKSMDVSWTVLKNFSINRNSGIQYVELEDGYWLMVIVSRLVLTCTLPKDNGADVTEFETTYKAGANKSVAAEVVTQLEKNDKTLKCAFAYGITNASGVAEARYPIPAAGRWLAYGDAAFKTRHFFDRITGIWLRDDDRLIAWQVAFAWDPEASEPMPDAVIQALTAEDLGGIGPFPRYPILGGYEDEELPAAPPLFTDGPPSWGAGMTMTFAYGSTEVGPVGGYAFVEGNFYFVIQVQKGEDCPAEEKAGHWLAISIDGAKADP